MSDNKGTIALAVIALIIGAGGFGYFFVQQQLGILGGGPTIKARAYKSNTPQAISDNVWAKVTFTDESYDIGSCFNLATDTFVVPQTGYYQIHASLYFQNIADIKYYGICVSSTSNAFLLYSGRGSSLDPAFTSLTISVTDIVYLNAGENITLHGRRNSGSPTASIGGSSSGSYTFLSIWLLE